MLTSQELDLIDEAVLDNLPLTCDVQTKQSDGTWAVLIAGLVCAIDPTTARERATGRNVYDQPLDGILTCLFDSRIREGQRVVVKTVLGVAATGSQARVYQILAVDDLESLGRELECMLWKMS